MTKGFSVGAVLSASITAMFANLPAYLAIAVVFHAPFILFFLSGPHDPGVVAIAGAIDLLIFNLVASGAMTYGVVQQLRGQRPGIGDCIATGFRSFGRVLVTGLLVGLRVLVGLILLIVPGIIETCRLWVAVPATVMEGADAVKSVNRSIALTTGRRWGIFGVIILISIVSEVANRVLILALGSHSRPLPYLMLGVGILVGIWSACASAAGYYFLRSERENVDLEQLAKVFG